MPKAVPEGFHACAHMCSASCVIRPQQRPTSLCFGCLCCCTAVTCFLKSELLDEAFRLAAGSPWSRFVRAHEDSWLRDEVLGKIINVCQGLPEICLQHRSHRLQAVHQELLVEDRVLVSSKHHQLALQAFLSFSTRSLWV